MKKVFVLGACMLLVLTSQSQQTVCTQSGNQTTCTTGPTPYQQGQAIGAPIGQALGNRMYAHRAHTAAKKFCSSRPGATFYGPLGQVYCPTYNDLVVGAVNEFHSHHGEVMQNKDNAGVMVAYLEEHRLDPSREKSYELAYKALKKAKALQLYAKS
jgi:hypothetical protein